MVFLRLGLTSFGGPVAHLGYFRQDIVERRRWLDERAYADLVALCQLLPGPASRAASASSSGTATPYCIPGQATAQSPTWSARPTSSST